MIRIDTIQREDDHSRYVLAAVVEDETPRRIVPLCQCRPGHANRKEARECQTALPIARTIRTTQSLEAIGQ